MAVGSRHEPFAWPRRRLLGVFAAAGLGLPFAGLAAFAADDGNTTRGGAWLLGDNLSLAALLYDQGAPDATVQKFLGKAKTIADIFGVTIKPFPAKAAKASESSADLLHYLIKGDGALIGLALSKKYGADHGALFEVAVKSNLLITLYGPGDSLGQTIAGVVKSRLESIHLPPRLWSDVVTFVGDKRPQSEVKKAVFKMHKDVADFYIPGSG